MCFIRIALKLLILIVNSVNCCSEICKCSVLKSSAPGKSELGQRVVCSPESNLTSLNELHLNVLPSNVIFLILRETALSSIPSFSFAEFPGLQKLDLSKNNIFEIKDEAFFNLTSLMKLDLSHNKLVKLSSSIFKPLTSLQRLNLEANFINRLSDGLFEYQTALKVLNMGENPLICDCYLKWLIEWVNTNRVRLLPKSSCQFPLKLRGNSLLGLSKKDLHCNWPVQFPLFDLRPHMSQLVFQGDSLTFYCQVSNVEYDTNIIWTLNEKIMSSASEKHSVIETRYSMDSSLLVSSLFINSLQPYHSGFWKCHVSTLKGNDSRSVQVVVINNNKKVCHSTVSVDNKGEYVWPETLAGITVELDCTGKRVSALGYPGLYAYHSCSTLGIWESLDTSRCPYVSEVTVVLEQFAKANFSQANVLDSARGLRNYTSGGHLLKDKMDVVFISHTLQNYVQAVSQHHEIAEIIVDVTDTIMSLDRNLLKAAQVKDQACSRLMWILEQLAELLVDATLNRFRNNIAVEEFMVKSESFPGIICSSFMKNNYVYKSMMSFNDGKRFNEEKALHCKVANSTANSDQISDAVEASLQVPATIFQQLGVGMPSNVESHKLQFIIYRNSLLFTHSTRQGRIHDITSSVISGKIAHITLHNLTEPVIVSLRTAFYTNDVTPVWWDPEAFGGKGDWSTDGCLVLKVHRNVVTFSCNHLASFGLLQDVDALLEQYEFEMAQFRPCHPAVYIGSFVCTVPLTATVIVYCFGYKKLQMPKKTKHSVINTFISLTLLCLVFSFGIYQTDVAPICQGIGLILHYLTLCSLLWMLITASNLYKKILKADPPELPPDDAVTDHPLPAKPMLRFYLVGWGISSIICGISAAVHIENYGGSNYCFLSLNPSLGALYGPAITMLIFLSFMYLFVHCALHDCCTVRNLYATEDNIAIELTPTSGFASTDIYNEDKSSDSEEDKEYSYQSQLQGHATLLLLFLLAWLSAAATVGRPFVHFIPYDELIFAVLFCLFTSLIGIFTFFFFCHQRTDARQVLYCLLRHTKSNTANCNRKEIVSMAARLDTPVPSVTSQETQPIKSTPADHSLLHCCNSDNIVNNIQIFYNPRQSVVARRFFEKKRRLQHMQKNNLENATANKVKKSISIVNSDSSNSSQIVVGCQRTWSRTEGITNSLQNIKSYPTNDKYELDSAKKGESLTSFYQKLPVSLTMKVDGSQTWCSFIR